MWMNQGVSIKTELFGGQSSLTTISVLFYLVLIKKNKDLKWYMFLDRVFEINLLRCFVFRHNNNYKHSA